jgi:hypothetical protein
VSHRCALWPLSATLLFVFLVGAQLGHCAFRQNFLTRGPRITRNFLRGTMTKADTSSVRRRRSAMFRISLGLNDDTRGAT